MFKPLILYIGLRYTRAQKRTHFISFITLISIVGMALGITALITILSVMNGLQAEMQDRILGMASHITVSGEHEQLKDWQQVDTQLQALPNLVGVAPFVSGQVMLNVNRRVSGTVLRGILPDREHAVSDVVNNMQIGDIQALQAGSYNMILGSELANFLGVITGDKITVISPQVNAAATGILPKMHQFTVAGTFRVGVAEYDRNMILVHLNDAASLFNMENSVSGIRLKLADLFNAPAIAEQLQQQLQGNYRYIPWTEEHKSIFKSLKMEKRVMSIILILIIAVASFNIIATLVMVVTDKRSDIAILKTQGLTSRAVMGVFVVLGSVIGFLGTLLGTTGGVLLTLNIGNIIPALEKLMHRQIFAADLFYISTIPANLIWADVGTIALMSFCLTLLATLYPAWQASKVNPAEVLRYE